MSKIGHNGVDSGRLTSLVQRIEKLEEEKTGLANDISEVYSEAKSAGYDVKIIRQVIRERRKEKATRDEQLELYGNRTTPRRPLPSDRSRKAAEALRRAWQAGAHRHDQDGGARNPRWPDAGAGRRVGHV
jgi:uncharacterized protein (UPF0335 family)